MPGAPGTPWRDEVAARLDRYRARRKPRPPRYPSLALRFEEPARDAAADPAWNAFDYPQPQTFAAQALAMAPAKIEPPAPAAPDTSAMSGPPLTIGEPEGTPRVTAKIIEFPRFYTPPSPRADELASPVIDQPRILEVPEVASPPPALGGITIEPVAPLEPEKRLGIDIPLQSAPLGRRIVAALADSVIVLLASALFGFVFWKVVESNIVGWQIAGWKTAGILPPPMELLKLAAGVSVVLWAAYHYLMIVYSATTPGLWLARLELARFDGRRPNRRLRRMRVLASYLSAVSLGMGYFWVFLDEDVLCWHDRITHTYLAPQKPVPPAASASPGAG